MSGDLIDTTEMYLKAVYELEEAGIVPMRARITERLQHSGPTVSQTVARMQRDHLLELDADRRIRFTEQGRALATAVMRKHRLVERHLVDHLSLPLPLVHEEACRWEHVVSDDVERRIAERLAPPWTDPFGNPIPGLAEIGVAESDASGAEGKGTAKPLQSLLDATPATGSARVRLVRIGEPAQAAEGVIDTIAHQGLGIGRDAEVSDTLVGVELRTADGARAEIPADAAAHILVAPITEG